MPGLHPASQTHCPCAVCCVCAAGSAPPQDAHLQAVLAAALSYLRLVAKLYHVDVDAGSGSGGGMSASGGTTQPSPVPLPEAQDPLFDDFYRQRLAR